MSARDVELLREGYEAFNRGDFEFFLDRMAPDMQIRDRAEVPDPQVYEGREGALAAMANAGELFDDYRVEPQEFVEIGEQIVVVVRQSGRGKESGAPVEGDLVHVWHVRDGRALDMRAFTTKEEALEAAGGEA